MIKIAIKHYDVVDQVDLVEMSVNQIPTDADPIEIKENYITFVRIFTNNNLILR